MPYSGRSDNIACQLTANTAQFRCNIVIDNCSFFATFNDMQYSVIMSLDFFSWLDSLKNKRATAAIASRLKRAERGNLGDCKPVGHGNTIVLMLAGGDKSTQKCDIAAAIQLAGEMSL